MPKLLENWQSFIMDSQRKTKKDLFVSFMSDTTLHGCRYTVDRQFHIFENCLWSVIVLVFFSLGSYLVVVVLESLLKRGNKYICINIFFK